MRIFKHFVLATLCLSPVAVLAQVTEDARAALLADVASEIGDPKAAETIVNCGVEQLQGDGIAALNAAKTTEARDSVMSEYVDLETLFACAGDALQ